MWILADINLSKIRVTLDMLHFMTKYVLCSITFWLWKVRPRRVPGYGVLSGGAAGWRWSRHQIWFTGAVVRWALTGPPAHPPTRCSCLLLPCVHCLPACCLPACGTQACSTTRTVGRLSCLSWRWHPSHRRTVLHVYAITTITPHLKRTVHHCKQLYYSQAAVTLLDSLYL